MERMIFGKKTTKGEVSTVTLNLELTEGRDKRKFEWIQDYKGIRDVITQYIPRKGAIILHPGCGMSRVPELMYNEGYTYIMNIDRSKQCIDYMRSQYPKMPNTFQCKKLTQWNVLT